MILRRSPIRPLESMRLKCKSYRICCARTNMSYFYNRLRLCRIILRKTNLCATEETAMKKNKMTFCLLVKNYDEALAFYTQKLGFVVVEDFSMGEDRWVTITL